MENLCHGARDNSSNQKTKETSHTSLQVLAAQNRSVSLEGSHPTELPLTMPRRSDADNYASRLDQEAESTRPRRSCAGLRTIRRSRSTKAASSSRDWPAALVGPL